jgi:hypothetical protein
MRTITLPHATVTYTPEGCYSTFTDGSSYGALPHDSHHYHVIAHRCGYGDDILAYAREHEVFHHIVGEHFYGGVSPVLWALAHGREISAEEAALEEAMVMTLQRWVRAGERPIIGGLDWDGLKASALDLLDG